MTKHYDYNKSMADKERIKVEIRGLKADDPLWRKFKSIAALEGQTLAQALKEAITCYSQVKNSSYKLLPVLARVPAGFPSSAEQVQDYIPAPKTISDSCYVVRVVGDSMFPELKNGDYVVVKPFENYSTIPEDYIGKLIIAFNDSGDYTIKRLQRVDGNLILVPTNPKYDPIPVDGDGWYIAGKVLGKLDIKVDFTPLR